jgi:hypothetical protein
MMDATHGETEKRPGVVNKNVELVTTYFGFTSAHWTVGRQNQCSALCRFRTSFNPGSAVYSFSEGGTSDRYAIESLFKWLRVHRPMLAERWLGPERVLHSVLLDWAAGGIKAAREFLKAQVSQYELRTNGRLRRTKHTLLRNCIDHALRNAVEPGHTGWLQKIRSYDKHKVADSLRTYIRVPARCFPVVLFDIFWRKYLVQIATKELPYPDGFTEPLIMESYQWKKMVLVSYWYSNVTRTS